MERLAKECKMRLYRTSVKEDLNVSGVFQHLAENYVNKVKSFTCSNGSSNNGLSHGHGGVEMFQIGASSHRPSYSVNNYVTNNNSRGPLYITKPPQRQKIQLQPQANSPAPQSISANFLANGKNNFSKNGYIPSAYSNSPTRHRVISTPTHCKILFCAYHGGFFAYFS